MAFAYKYEVTGLKVKDDGGITNFVVQTYWKLTGTDENGNEGTFSGATPFTADPNDNSGPRIPFESLTEEDVISWISDVVNTNPGYKDHIDQQIQKQIDDEITPITEPSLPWAPAANTANTTI